MFCYTSIIILLFRMNLAIQKAKESGIGNFLRNYMNL